MKLVLASALSGAAAFSAVPLTPLTGGRAAATVTMKLSESEQPMSRRAAVLAAAGTAAAAMPVFAAFADDNEDAMLAIARRNAEKNAAAEANKVEKTEEQLEAEKAQAIQSVVAVGAGGTLLSTAFFYKNIQRLFIKISSGGADDGYATVSDKGGRGKKAPAGNVRRGKADNAGSKSGGLNFLFGKSMRK